MPLKKTILLISTLILLVFGCSLPLPQINVPGSPTLLISATEIHIVPTPETPQAKPSIESQNLPDLVFEYYVVQYDPEHCPWGGPGKITARIMNIGLSDAGSFVVTINQKLALIEGLSAGSEIDAAVEFTEGPIGRVEVEIDSTKQIVELDEDNNVFWIVFTPPPQCTDASTP
ncbi:MAG: hypothetical protein MUO76_08160 [Anaerolineaceae bacterium]|nr:hypothetical protein [Anaerolineaceae bacterium]